MKKPTRKPTKAAGVPLEQLIINLRAASYHEAKAREAVEHAKLAMAGWLQDQRAALRLSARELARRAGVSVVYLRDLERGRRPMSEALLNRLREAMDQGGKEK